MMRIYCHIPLTNLSFLTIVFLLQKELSIPTFYYEQQALENLFLCTIVKYFEPPVMGGFYYN